MFDQPNKTELTEEDLEGVSDFVRTVAEIYFESSSERTDNVPEEKATGNGE